MEMSIHRPSILIVDDEYRLGRFVATALERVGYTTQTCSSAAEARTLMATGEWQLVISDILMPRESGLDLANWINAWYPWVPTILITAHTSETIMNSALQVGAAAVLYKPFTVDHLRQTIQDVLTQMPAMPPWRVEAISKYQ
jgi:DNA-binding NtrC family response regulator